MTPIAGMEASEKLKESSAKIVSDLFVDLFEDNDAIRRFLEAHSETRAVAKEIPSVLVSRAAFAAGASASLECHGLIAPPLFERLVLCRSAKVGAISRAARRLGINWELPSRRHQEHSRLRFGFRTTWIGLLLALPSVYWAFEAFQANDAHELCAEKLPPSGDIAEEHDLVWPSSLAPYTIAAPRQLIGAPASPSEVQDVALIPNSDRKKPGVLEALPPKAEDDYTEDIPQVEKRQNGLLNLDFTSTIDGRSFSKSVPAAQSCENAAEDTFFDMINSAADPAMRRRFEHDKFELCQATRCCRTETTGHALDPSKAVRIKRNGSFQNYPEPTGTRPSKNRALPR